MSKKISIILPAHNEDGNLNKCVKSLMRACKKLDYEIIIVDDASTDKTANIADRLSRSNKKIRAVHRKPPNGFGRAIKTGLESSKGKIIIPFMADLSDDPKTIPKLVNKIESGYDIAIGSRFVSGGYTVDYPRMKYIAHRVYNTIVGILFLKNIKDFSNAFKAYNRNILRGVEIKSSGFEITSEMILKPIAKYDARVVEVPTVWRNRKSGKAKFMGLYKQGWRYGKIMMEALTLRILR